MHNFYKYLGSYFKYHKLALSILLITVLIVGLSIPAIAEFIKYTIVPSSDSVYSVSPLYVEGQYIKDSTGKIVTLHGVNNGGFADSPGGSFNGVSFYSYETWTAHIDDVAAELDAIKSSGFNCIRVMFASEFWVYNEGNHRQVIHELANLCAQRGLYLIYEPYGIWGYGHGPTQISLPYPPYQIDNTGIVVENASTVIPSEQAYIEMMVNIATTLHDHSNIIFGAWNEPLGNSTNNWFVVMQEMVNAIRAAKVENIILLQTGYGLYSNLNFPPNPPPELGGQPASTMSWVYEYNIQGSNIAYQTHLYDAWGTNMTYQQLIQGFTDCWVPYLTQTMNKPLIIGEIGANQFYTGDDLSAELNTLNLTLQILNNWHIGYIGWIWSTNGPYRLITTNSPSFLPSDAGKTFLNSVQSYQMPSG